jgi:septin family protein
MNLNKEVVKLIEKWDKEDGEDEYNLVKLALERGMEIGKEKQKVQIDNIDNKVVCDFCNQQRNGFIINLHDIGVETHRLCYECYHDPYGFIKGIKEQAKLEGKHEALEAVREKLHPYPTYYYLKKKDWKALKEKVKE